MNNEINFKNLPKIPKKKKPTNDSNISIENSNKITKSNVSNNSNIFNQVVTNIVNREVENVSRNNNLNSNNQNLEINQSREIISIQSNNQNNQIAKKLNFVPYTTELKDIIQQALDIFSDYKVVFKKFFSTEEYNNLVKVLKEKKSDINPNHTGVYSLMEAFRTLGSKKYKQNIKKHQLLAIITREMLGKIRSHVVQKKTNLELHRRFAFVLKIANAVQFLKKCPEGFNATSNTGKTNYREYYFKIAACINNILEIIQNKGNLDTNECYSLYKNEAKSLATWASTIKSSILGNYYRYLGKEDPDWPQMYRFVSTCIALSYVKQEEFLKTIEAEDKQEIMNYLSIINLETNNVFEDSENEDSDIEEISDVESEFSIDKNDPYFSFPFDEESDLEEEEKVNTFTVYKDPLDSFPFDEEE